MNPPITPQQPSTVTGISAVFAAIVGLLTHQLSWAQAMPILLGAALSIILPDSTQAGRATPKP
jgi:hypothetical protein